MRYLIDTHIFIWYLKERENLSCDVIAILEDYDNQIYLSAESLRKSTRRRNIMIQATT